MRKLLKKKLRVGARRLRRASRAVLRMGKKAARKTRMFLLRKLKKIRKNRLGDFRRRLSQAAAVAMVAGMLLQNTGLVPTNTLAYFSDFEASAGNLIGATSLGFRLQDGGWSQYAHTGGLLPGDSIERLVKVEKLSGLNFQYKATAVKTSGSAAFCAALKIQALRENIEAYNGSLLGLDIVPAAVIDPDGADDWKFVLSLPGSAAEYPGLACEFDLVFYGWQPNMLAGGFNDTEILGNVAEGISSGPETDEFVQGISPIGDAYVDEHSDNNNYGSQHNLFVRSKSDNQGNQENRRAFVKFDLPIPPIASVTQASLKLRLTSAPGEERMLEAARALGAWTESGIKWNNQPGASAAVTDVVSTGVMNDVWKAWNVTGDVQGFASGAYANHGWRVKDASEGAENSEESVFASREHSSEIYGPILELKLKAQAATTTHLVINEVYYHVGSAGVGNDAHNEWVEVYNPTANPVDISGWKICDNTSCDVIPTTTPIASKGFAVITNKNSTWGYWPGMPGGAVRIELDSEIGGGLANTGDRVLLKDASDALIDQMSYGSDTSVFNPAVPHSGNGRSVARIIKGYDNDAAADWVINATPNPGTNPSEDGEEVLRFTPEGMEIARTSEELTPLVDNPVPQARVLSDEASDSGCACSQAGGIPSAPVGGGGGSSAAEPVEELPQPMPEEPPVAESQPEELAVPANPEEPAPAPENAQDETLAPSSEAAAPAEPSAPEPEPAAASEPEPEPETPVPSEEQAIEPQPAEVPPPAELTPSGGSNE